MEDNGVLS